MCSVNSLQHFSYELYHFYDVFVCLFIFSSVSIGTIIISMVTTMRVH